jgi:hypothetical protein
MGICDLFGKLLKVRISLPYSNCISDASFPIDNQELSILAVFLGLGHRKKRAR